MDTTTSGLTEEIMMINAPLRTWIIHHLKKGDITGLELVNEPHFPPWSFRFPWVRMGDPDWMLKWSVIFAYAEHRNFNIPPKDHWRDKEVSKQITELKNKFRNAMDKSNDFRKIADHTFGANFRCYCVHDNKKTNQNVNYNHNVYGGPPSRKRPHNDFSENISGQLQYTGYNNPSTSNSYLGYQQPAQDVHVLQNVNTVNYSVQSTPSYISTNPAQNIIHVNTSGQSEFNNDSSSSSQPTVTNDFTQFMEETSNIDIKATEGNDFNMADFLQSTPVATPMTNTGNPTSPMSPMSSRLNPISPLHPVPPTPKQVAPTSDQPSYTSLNNANRRVSPKKLKSLNTVITELNIKKDDLASFQVSVIYDKMLQNYHCQLDKGLQINLDKNYNEGIRRGDAVMKELIEDVGSNVKTFKYKGDYDRVTNIITSSKGGIILKLERGTLKVYRLCQCRVYVGSYGCQDYQKVCRSSSETGPVPFEVFSFHKFVSGYQNSQLHSHVTTIRFGSPKHDYVEVRVTPMCGSLIERHLNTTEESFDSIRSVTRSIDQDLTRRMEQTSITSIAE